MTEKYVPTLDDIAKDALKARTNVLTDDGKYSNARRNVLEKEWTEDFVDQINFVNIPRMTIKRRYENKGIDLLKLIKDISYYKHVKDNVNSRGSLEFDKKK